MKHKLLLTLLSAAVVTSASAQGKINFAGMEMIHNYKAKLIEAASDADKRTLAAPADQEVGVLMELVPGANESFLSEFGLEPSASFGSILLVSMPISLVERVAECSQVQTMEFGNTMSPDMNYGRSAANVDQVQNGFSYNGSTVSYDGTGVVTGVMDSGMDPNHANFRDADGNLRVTRLWNFNGSNGSCVTYDTPARIGSFSTDTRSTTHGTHVAGIMAGSYTGTGQWMKQSSASAISFSKSSTAIPFKGVATGSEIAMSAAPSLTDANILTGVKKIVEYAESAGKPCVINMSLGSNRGPHDGTDLYSRTLASLGERAIICMSAGNEGDLNMYVTKTLTGTSNTLKTFIAGNSAESGYIDIWASTDQPLTVSWVIYDTSTRTSTAIYTTSTSSSGGFTYIGSGVGYVSNTLFSNNFNGALALASNLVTTNNRYNVNAIISAEAKSSNATKLLGLEITGAAGQVIDVYGTNVTFTNNRYVTGSVAGTPAGSINDAAAASNIISVGSYNTRLTAGCLDGAHYTKYPSNYILGSISPFSSYGKTFQGVSKPDLCAPGCGIVSSISTPYVNATSGASTYAVGKATAYGRQNYWDNMQGTSMSCPFFAGVVALWLEADNSLDYSDIMDVVNATCTKDIQVLGGGNAERWGAGKVDALAGIKYVLDNKASIGTISADEPEKMVFVTPTADGYEIYVAGAAEVNASLYSVSGMQAKHVSVPGNTAALTTDGLQSGIYVLSVDTPAGRYTTKLAVK